LVLATEYAIVVSRSANANRNVAANRNVNVNQNGVRR
jgi:hypothetical protein